MITKNLTQLQIQALCDVLGDTSQGFTKSELTHLLNQCNIPVVDDGSYNDGYTYKIGLKKSK